jgi:drug/metabolite transporter (DMT)-like permease
MSLSKEEDNDGPTTSLTARAMWLLSPSRVGPIMVPALIYLCQNVLAFVAIERIDAATFTVVAQGKVLSTALFSVLLLGRALGPRKWRALVSLTCGVILVAQGSSPARATASGHSEAATAASLQLHLLGLGAVTADVLLSGLASVYFEKVIKSTEIKLSGTSPASRPKPQSAPMREAVMCVTALTRHVVHACAAVWDRNFQLAAVSAPLYLPLALQAVTPERGFFAGFTFLAHGVAVMGNGWVLVRRRRFASRVAGSVDSQHGPCSVGHPRPRGVLMPATRVHSDSSV